MAKAFFNHDARGNKKKALEEATMGVVDIGFNAARDALKYVVIPTPSSFPGNGVR